MEAATSEQQSGHRQRTIDASQAVRSAAELNDQQGPAHAAGEAPPPVRTGAFQTILRGSTTEATLPAPPRAHVAPARPEFFPLRRSNTPPLYPPRRSFTSSRPSSPLNTGAAGPPTGRIEGRRLEEIKKLAKKRENRRKKLRTGGVVVFGVISAGLVIAGGATRTVPVTCVGGGVALITTVGTLVYNRYLVKPLTWASKGGRGRDDQEDQDILRRFQMDV